MAKRSIQEKVSGRFVCHVCMAGKACIACTDARSRGQSLAKAAVGSMSSRAVTKEPDMGLVAVPNNEKTAISAREQNPIIQGLLLLSDPFRNGGNEASNFEQWSGKEFSIHLDRSRGLVRLTRRKSPRISRTDS